MFYDVFFKRWVSHTRLYLKSISFLYNTIRFFLIITLIYNSNNYYYYIISLRVSTIKIMYSYVVLGA